MNVLVLCTANRCRSPLAAALLARFTGDEPERVEVRSSGTHALEDDPAMDHSITIGRELGVDISQHRSTVLDLDLALWADLIVTMESAQATEVAGRFPGSEPRTFLLRELAGLPLDTGEPWLDWLERVGSGRTVGDLMTEGFDIEDPVGRPLARHRAMGRQVSGSIADWLVNRPGVRARPKRHQNPRA